MDTSRAWLTRRQAFTLVCLTVLALALTAAPAHAVAWNRTGSVSVGRLAPLAQISATAVDDDVPGVSLDTYPIISRTVTGTLNAFPPSAPPEDAADVYSLYLAPGEQVELALTGTGANFNLYLLSPDTLSVGAPRYVAVSENLTSTESICYSAAGLFGAGRYFVVVRTGDSEGEYALMWKITGRSDGNIPGTPLQTSSVTGTVNAATDADDVYRLPLDMGQTLTVTVTADVPGVPVELTILPPVYENGGILEPTLDVWHAGDAINGQGTAVTCSASVNVPGRQGEYTIDVYAPNGTTGYTLEWSVKPQLIPGTPLPASPVESALDTRTVYSIPLRVGDTFTGSVDTSTGADVSARIYAPGSLGPNAYRVVWENTGATDPKLFSYAVPSAAEGTYYLEFTPDGAAPVRVGWSVKRASTRVQGADRYDTAVQASRAAFPDGAETVIVASGANFPDALAAASLAGTYDAPLLLVQLADVPLAVRTEIVRLGAKRVFIVGGDPAVSANVATAIEAVTGRVPERIAGSDRYSTAAEVARRVVNRLGDDYDHGVFVARGDTFPDALAVAPLAWQSRRPVVLTRPLALPAVTAGVLEDIGATDAMVAGGSPAVSEAVRLEVESIVGSAIRVAGVDRYATAVGVAQWGVEHGIVRYRFVGVATGLGFADALGGGVAAGAEGGVLLLTRPDLLPVSVANVIRSNDAGIRWVRVYGSTRAVSAAPVRAIDTLLK